MCIYFWLIIDRFEAYSLFAREGFQSNHNQKWTINENVVDALSFIKSKTNVSLSENYKSNIENHLEQVSIEEKAQMEADLKAQEIQGYKDRIAALTEKFKNDPTKLAILSKLAQEVNKVNVEQD